MVSRTIGPSTRDTWRARPGDGFSDDETESSGMHLASRKRKRPDAIQCLSNLELESPSRGVLKKAKVAPAPSDQPTPGCGSLPLRQQVAVPYACDRARSVLCPDGTLSPVDITVPDFSDGRILDSFLPRDDDKREDSRATNSTDSRPAEPYTAGIAPRETTNHEKKVGDHNNRYTASDSREEDRTGPECGNLLSGTTAEREMEHCSWGDVGNIRH